MVKRIFFSFSVFLFYLFYYSELKEIEYPSGYLSRQIIFLEDSYLFSNTPIFHNIIEKYLFITLSLQQAPPSGLEAVFYVCRLLLLIGSTYSGSEPIRRAAVL